MIDDWFKTIELKISFDEFERLPRTIGYKHEYFDGRCVLTPRPKSCYAALELANFAEPPPYDFDHREISLRRLEESDWEPLGNLCGFAFQRIPPFGSLTDQEKVTAGQDCMGYLRKGGDGPLIEEASIVAVGEDGHLWGAILIVLKPDGYREDPWRHNRWKEPVPADAIAARRGQAHLDWIFVSPWQAGRGLASAMLAETVRVLRELGFQSLTSSFMLGNGESMAWHWRNGFTLLPNPASMRYWEQNAKKKDGD